jgi:hypothetical protein
MHRNFNEIVLHELDYSLADGEGSGILYRRPVPPVQAESV